MNKPTKAFTVVTTIDQDAEPRQELINLADRLEEYGGDQATIDVARDTAEFPDVTMEAADMLIDSIINEFTDMAPGYVHFGRRDNGHGEWEYGFWPSVNEAVDDEDIPTYSDLADAAEDAEERGAPPYFLIRSDHGNLTLYRAGVSPTDPNVEEVWSVV